MTITLNGTTGITTPDITSDSYTGAIAVNASAPDNSLVVNSSGNVGIGTNSPTVKLHVFDSTTYAAGVETNTTYAFLGLKASGSGGTMADPNVGIGATVQNLIFRAGGAERGRIDSSGNLLVGTTNPISGYTNTVTGVVLNPNGISTFSRSGADYAMVVNSNNAGIQYLIAFRASGGAVGNITSNGTSTNYATTSDYRLKEDWVAVADASTRVNALKPVNFAWISSGERVDGFLAHELADVVPEAVTGSKDATEMVDIKDEEGNVTGQEERPVYQGIDQSKLVPLLTAALQEALAAIETLTARVSALEAK